MILDELCFSGASNRGICYIGCLKKFEEMDMLKINKILGVSIGAFISVCYVIGYTPDEMIRIIIEKDMKEFRDFTFGEQGAMLKGENYRQWVHDVLAEKTDPKMTMMDFYKKYNVYFITTATCIYSSTSEFKEGIVHLSHELTPDIPLIVALNATMALPFVFPPVCYNGAKFIDGGMLDNIPSGFMKKDSLKIKVSFKPIDGLTSTKNPISYIGKIFELVSMRIASLKGEEENNNFISINCEDFNVIDFDLDIDDKITLYKRGYNAAEEYLSSISSGVAHDTTEITRTD